ncbi:C-type lectin domain family 19 member A-like [Diadema antillarum]|uniref:C-type lectin domain family 19 member A-like n=1 Tax=Diadema antillarum TaxID=105358 RepID=UPI003A85E42C
MVSMATTSLAHCQQRCPQFWHLFQGHCYRYFGERVSWSSAEAECNKYLTNRGCMARLISIHSEEENNFAYELFRSSAGDTPDWRLNRRNPSAVYGFWTGAHQQVSDGPWVHTDGTAFDYINWMSGEPNDNYYDLHDEDCVMVWRRYDMDDDLRQMNDEYCDDNVSFICKMKANN